MLPLIVVTTNEFLSFAANNNLDQRLLIGPRRGGRIAHCSNEFLFVGLPINDTDVDRAAAKVRTYRCRRIIYANLLEYYFETSFRTLLLTRLLRCETTIY